MGCEQTLSVHFFLGGKKSKKKKSLFRAEYMKLYVCLLFKTVEYRKA